MRKLIVDAQLFQTPAWHRGMGKYSLELLISISEYNEIHKTWSSIELLLSDNTPVDSEMLDTLNNKLPQATVTSLNFYEAELNNVSSASNNRKIVEAHIQNTTDKADKVDYLILSLLQSGISPSFPELSNVHKVLLFYDLIPLMFHSTYLSRSVNRQEYCSRLAEFFRADTYLTISKTVANDLAWHTGISAKRIFNINGGPINHSKKLKKIAVATPFILMPTGDDLRKNNRRGIESFAAFNKKNNNKYTLVITSTFTEHEKIELQKITKHVHFTGNISGSELNYLYAHSDLLMFPTEYEGLGLPILEAMEHNKPVLCSNISVFREISSTLYEMFDPKDVQSIERALQNFVDGKVAVDKKGYKEILGQYTWASTAKAAAVALTRSTESVPPKNTQRGLTVFTPNPSNSLLGHHVQLLHSELSKLHKITYRYESDYDAKDSRINYTQYVTTGSMFLGGHTSILLTEKNINLYHIENSRKSVKTLFTALANPGIVVLYENSLADAWKAMVGLNLVDATRQKIETELSKKYQSSENLLISIVLTQKAIVVSNAALSAKIKTLAESLGRIDLKIYIASIPGVGVPYPEILPKKKHIKQTTIDSLGATEHDLIELMTNSKNSTISLAGVDKKILQAMYNALITETSENRKNTKPAKHAGSYIDFANTLHKISQEVYNENE